MTSLFCIAGSLQPQCSPKCSRLLHSPVTTGVLCWHSCWGSCSSELPQQFKLLCKEMYLFSSTPFMRPVQIAFCVWRVSGQRVRIMHKVSCAFCSEMAGACRSPAPVEAEGMKLSCKARLGEQVGWGTSLLLCPHPILWFCCKTGVKLWWIFCLLFLIWVISKETNRKLCHSQHKVLKGTCEKVLLFLSLCSNYKWR